MDPEIDFSALFEQFDTFLLGRRTFELMAGARKGETPGIKTFVFSRTLRQQDYPGVTIVAEGVAETVAALRAEPAPKDIWLAGGGALFRTLLDAALVDTVEIGVSPLLLGRAGVPLLAVVPPLPQMVRLALTRSEALPTGLLVLEYAVVAAPS